MKGVRVKNVKVLKPVDASARAYTCQTPCSEEEVQK